jgi:GDP-4-dehydro-6-deoxy-D-mannose reductase
LPLPGRILVTGASGFVGRHLVRLIRDRWPAATVLAASREGSVAGADETVPLDLLDREGMAVLLEAARPDAVVHLAAQAAVGESFQDPGRTWRVNVDGSLALAQVLRDKLPECLLVLASSAEVYGLTFQSGEPLDEQAPMAPANPYAASKAAVDLALGEMALRGLRLVRLRPFNQVGPGQSDAFVIAAFARQLARIEAGLQPPVLRVGALDRWRDFLDVRDVCAAYIAVLDRAEALPPGIAINIASGTPRKVGDILQALLARVAVPVEVQVEAARLRPTDVVRVAGNAARAADLLGWRPAAAWDDTLDTVLADWRGRVQAPAQVQVQG